LSRRSGVVSGRDQDTLSVLATALVPGDPIRVAQEPGWQDTELAPPVGAAAPVRAGRHHHGAALLVVPAPDSPGAVVDAAAVRVVAVCEAIGVVILSVAAARANRLRVGVLDLFGADVPLDGTSVHPATVGVAAVDPAVAVVVEAVRAVQRLVGWGLFPDEAVPGGTAVPAG